MKRLMADPLYAPATAGGSDIRSAFRSAIASATAGGAVTVPARSGRDADTDDDDEAAEAGDEGEEEDEDEDSAAGEGEDDADEDDAEPADDADEEEDDTKEDDEADETEDEDEDAKPPAKAAELLTDKEIKAIQRAHPNDPQAQLKAFQASYTKKTQEIAKQAKSYKGLLSYLPLVQAYEKDPVDTIKRLARMNGMDPAELAAEIAPKGKAKGKPAAADEDTTDFVATIMDEFKKDLGPELEYMADQLGPAMTKALTKIAGHTVEKRVKGLEDATVTLTRGNAEAESDRVMESFYTKHPDAQDEDFTTEMDDLAATLVGGRNGEPFRSVPMSEKDFLEFLYDTVSNKRAAATSKETIDKEARRLMKKRLTKLNTARSGERRATGPTVTDEHIRRRPRGPVSIRDAYKAAVRGVKFDDGDDDE
jgi:hypothetical protein